MELLWTCDGGSPTICTIPCGRPNYQGYYECGDGNLINGDGCDDQCRTELGWYCVNGDPTKNETCYELCGDGRNHGQHECDDGNRVNLDGCDEWCDQEEQGFLVMGQDTFYPVPVPEANRHICESGNELSTDWCHDWCGDGV